MTFRCSHCGKKIALTVSLVPAEMTDTDWTIIDYLKMQKEVFELPDCAVRTKIISRRIGIGMDQTLRILTRLEKRGLVARIGQRGGWFLP